MTGSFDENSPKYWVLFKRLHIRMAARGICLALIVVVLVALIQSFGHSTAVMFYSWLAACFAVGIYGSLTYGVFKEKRLFLMPFLCFQAVLIGFFSLSLFIFTMSALFSPTTLNKIGTDFGSVEEKAKPEDQAKQLRGFVVYFFVMCSLITAIQLWFLETIYRFFHFLKDRESTFNFNLENEFQMTD